MDFTVDKEKAIEALVYIATALPGVDRFHACKILYFAERDHLRSFGRPSSAIATMLWQTDPFRPSHTMC